MFVENLKGLLLYTLSWAGQSSKSEPNQCAMNLSVTHVLYVETVSENPSCALDDQL